MTNSILQERLAIETELALRRSVNDFPFFLEKFVWTLDEHDKINPVKRVPNKDYVKELASLLEHEQLLLIEKSRQMMVTWICCAYCLWVAMLHPGRRVFVQSKKEKDADELINRIKFIYQRLPHDMLNKEWIANEPMSYLNLRFGKHESVIQGTPQGADVLRQYTASVIFSDELAFQEKAEEAFVAAKPTLTGGGQFIGVSSPNFKEFFYRAVHDIMGS